jgi:RNA-directed DNA polymerase
VRADLARALAAGFLDGEWTQQGLVASGTAVLGRRPPWLVPLARQTLALYPRAPADRPRELATNIASRPAAARSRGAAPQVQPVVSTRMLANRWRLPVLEGLGDVADFLAVSPSELDWFADPRHLARGT